MSFKYRGKAIGDMSTELYHLLEVIEEIVGEFTIITILEKMRKFSLLLSLSSRRI